MNTQKEPASPWRSIDSAPMDATWVILRLKDGSEVWAHYACGDGDGLMPPFDGWFKKCGDKEFLRSVARTKRVDAGVPQ